MPAIPKPRPYRTTFRLLSLFMFAAACGDYWMAWQRVSWTAVAFCGLVGLSVMATCIAVLFFWVGAED